jgi:hypothetical protein
MSSPAVACPLPCTLPYPPITPPPPPSTTPLRVPPCSFSCGWR